MDYGFLTIILFLGIALLYAHNEVAVLNRRIKYMEKEQLKYIKK